MLRASILPVTPFAQNCSIVWCDRTGTGAVIDPRGVLKEFGVALADEVELKVWDSTAELRYLVVPQRPADTDGWSEDKLAELVTRDSMIGTALAREAA